MPENKYANSYLFPLLMPSLSHYFFPDWTTVIISFAGSQTIFYANFKPSKTTRPRRFFKLIISAFPATVLIVYTDFLSPKDASLNYFGSLHALSSLNNLLIFLIFYQSDTHVNHSDPCTLVSSFINLFLQACLLVALFLTRLHVCGIHFLLTCAHRLLS